MKKVVSALAVGIWLFGVAVAAQTPRRTAARLVEVHALPGCAGLDCPPWPMPTTLDVCIESEGIYYTAAYLPWGVPWAKAGEKLLRLAGQPIEVEISGNAIQGFGPQIRAKLTRTHFSGFTSAACKSS